MNNPGSNPHVAPGGLRNPGRDAGGGGTERQKRGDMGVPRLSPEPLGVGGQRDRSGETWAVPRLSPEPLGRWRDRNGLQHSDNQLSVKGMQATCGVRFWGHETRASLPVGAVVPQITSVSRQGGAFPHFCPLDSLSYGLAAYFSDKNVTL